MARSLNKAKKTKKEGRNSMAENIVFQILRSHLMEGELTPGAPIAIRVDQTLGHDLTGIMAGQTFLAVGADRVQTEASVFIATTTPCASAEKTRMTTCSSRPRRPALGYISPNPAMGFVTFCTASALPGPAR